MIPTLIAAGIGLVEHIVKAHEAAHATKIAGQQKQTMAAAVIGDLVNLLNNFAPEAKLVLPADLGTYIDLAVAVANEIGGWTHSGAA